MTTDNHTPKTGRTPQRSSSMLRRTVRNWLLSILGILFVAYVTWDVFLSENGTPVHFGEADEYAVQPPEMSAKQSAPQAVTFDDAEENESKTSVTAAEVEAAADAVNAENNATVPEAETTESVTPESLIGNTVTAPATSSSKPEESSVPALHEGSSRTDNSQLFD